MTGRILTAAEMTAERVEITTSAAGLAAFSVGRPWRVQDIHAAMPWRVTARIGSIVRVQRYRDERAAVIGHAQLVADVIALSRAA